jgi:hypothetical protein
MQWLGRLVAGLSPSKPGLSARSVRVGYVVDRVALRQVFLRVLRVSPIIVVPPMLHACTFIYNRR